MIATKYDPNWVRDYYDAEGLKEWGRFDLHLALRVSFAVHCHYLRQYLQPTDRILEIGAGCGRFTQVLADITSRITVADISPGQLALNRHQATSLGFDHAVERWVECDVCDLSGYFADEEFDTVVCYGGPLSYVFDRVDVALQELKRVVKPGGYLFLEVMSLWGAIHSYLKGVLDLSPEINRSIIADGDLIPERAVSSHMMHMYRAGEFRQLLERAELETVVLSTSNALSTNWQDSLGDLSEDSETWQFLLEMELEACCEPGCLDLGTHMIAVCRKAGE